MSDCIMCRLRLETAGRQILPFCANEECSMFDKIALKRAERLLHK